MALPVAEAGAPVAITGASSGIGTELARTLARKGYPLIVIARRTDRLETLAGELQQDFGVAVQVRTCDLADAEQRRELGDELNGRGLAGLCNNAGFGTSGFFADMAVEREQEQVHVNVLAVHELTHAVLGGMVARGAGAILNVASIAAFQPMPSMATYAATKAFVHSFTEALHEELRGSGVSCTSLCPGPVPTEWSGIAAADEFAIWPGQLSASTVARMAVAGMQGGRRQVLPGSVVKAAAAASRLAPRSISLPVLSRGRQLASRVRRR